MKNKSFLTNFRRVLRLVTMIVIAVGLWLGYESLNRLHSFTVVGKGTAGESVVFTPGLSFIVLYSGFAIVILIPPTLIGLTLLIPDKDQQQGGASPIKTRLTVVSSTCFAVFGVCLSAAILGYVYEATHTEIRINK